MAMVSGNLSLDCLAGRVGSVKFREQRSLGKGTRLQRRNARFASIGNGIGTALMGACGYYTSELAVCSFRYWTALPPPASASSCR